MRKMDTLPSGWSVTADLPAVCVSYPSAEKHSPSLKCRPGSMERLKSSLGWKPMRVIWNTNYLRTRLWMCAGQTANVIRKMKRSNLMKEALDNKLDKRLFNYELESVNGKNILITGGTTGIGRATAILLAAQGANVLIFGRHDQELQDAIHDIQETGGSVTGLT